MHVYIKKIRIAKTVVVTEGKSYMVILTKLSFQFRTILIKWLKKSIKIMLYPFR